MAAHVDTAAKGLLTSFWHLLLIGVDMPPVRASMLTSLHLQKKGQHNCQHPNCAIMGCQGNQVQVDKASGKVTFVWVHHKSSFAADGILAGPICPSPPKGSLTETITNLVVTKALPYIYSKLVQVPKHAPLPMLPNVWTHGNGQPKNKFRVMTLNSLSIIWAKLLTSKAFVPLPTSLTADRGQLDMVAHPFPAGSMLPSDTRRLFITAFVEHEAELTSTLKGSQVVDLIRRVAARQVANQPETWKVAYDMLIKTREHAITASIMDALNRLVTRTVQRWRKSTGAGKRQRINQ
jgi:hypothetical protein